MTTLKEFQTAEQRHKDMQRTAEREHKTRTLLEDSKTEKPERPHALRAVLSLFV